MEREADRMEEESERVGEDIEDARDEWEAKERDPDVPPRSWSGCSCSSSTRPRYRARGAWA